MDAPSERQLPDSPRAALNSKASLARLQWNVKQIKANINGKDAGKESPKSYREHSALRAEREKTCRRPECQDRRAKAPLIFAVSTACARYVYKYYTQKNSPKECAVFAHASPRYSIGASPREYSRELRRETPKAPAGQYVGIDANCRRGFCRRMWNARKSLGLKSSTSPLQFLKRRRRGLELSGNSARACASFFSVLYINLSPQLSCALDRVCRKTYNRGDVIFENSKFSSFNVGFSYFHVAIQLLYKRETSAYIFQLIEFMLYKWSDQLFRTIRRDTFASAVTGLFCGPPVSDAQIGMHRIYRYNK